MSGTLTLDALRDFVKVGEIDTILVVFPDMQGRLLGKRVTGHYRHTGRWEQAECDRRITDWEVRRNFERG